MYLSVQVITYSFSQFSRHTHVSSISVSIYSAIPVVDSKAPIISVECHYYSSKDSMRLKAIIRRYAKGVARRDAANVIKACRCDNRCARNAARSPHAACMLRVNKIQISSRYYRPSLYAIGSLCWHRLQPGLYKRKRSFNAESRRPCYTIL